MVSVSPPLHRTRAIVLLIGLEQRKYQGTNSVLPTVVKRLYSIMTLCGTG